MSEYCTSELANKLIDETTALQEKGKKEKAEMEQKWEDTHKLFNLLNKTAYHCKEISCKEEALNWLDAVFNNPVICGGNAEDNNKALKIIKDELEILDILRKNIDFKEIHKRTMSEPIGGKFVLLHINVYQNKDEEKIEEWLKNG